ncbi:hypothetical protein MOC76_16520 [Bacillus spizizenii]|uniref:hypothetical protein n=1 Tax=Bacillus spizizenii TaxID=96241 RepID=UPI002281BFD7|nr:hypothetical protein [Bacillus spizizenii]MCY8063896.1 hypothetical protein [Bacillus spizizenii]MCY8135366.1 hypothetical protein [Bacillus spizizenii]MCY8256942.1 hypothetical protein [Bacillus spizizenii]MCY8334173.1 hypothetical protein [Bacillus spizizenii]MCY9443471.1 hypothetical protein [Bacillus spizizenii]
MFNEPQNKEIKNLVVKKFIKVFSSCDKALHNLNEDEVRMAIGDLDFVKENLDEIQFILRDIVFTYDKKKNKAIKDQNKM